VTAFLRRISRNGIPIYFATGRGDSIYETLVASFPKSDWERIFVSHYNGAFTLTVAQRIDFDRDCPDIEVLTDIHRGLAANALLEKLAIADPKRCQITVKVRKDSSSAVVSRVLTEVVAAVAPGRARLVQSSHSLDIIPLSSSKLNCVRMAESAVPAGGDVLTIGDRGAYPGNDFDLLTHPYSLSVDTVSSSLNSCWNLLPAGVRNVQGLLHYAKWINVRRGHFTVKIPPAVSDCK
jgi:hydroxymethylpyrimidine pyrophosphatase-like HAD family hydrolase